MSSNLAKESSIPTTDETTTASDLLKKFLEENSIEIRLTPQLVRQVDGGGIMIEAPQVVANFKQNNSIK